MNTGRLHSTIRHAHARAPTSRFTGSLKVACLTITFAAAPATAQPLVRSDQQMLWIVQPMPKASG